MRKKASTADNIYLLSAFAVMAILYYSSSMSYQEQTVQPLLNQWLENEPFRGLLERVAFMYAGSEVSIEASGYVGFIEFFLRKGAHFISYFFLGLFWYLGLRNRVDNPYLTVLLAVMLSIGYASFDELRQSFHPNRTALMEDVILDTAGAVTGIISGLLSTKPRRRRSRVKV
ncbi:VanZ family protein [Alkalibacterium pelagium]|jgi:VanZ family protein|uniref:VanZ like family protein n=1 Tax=Alkalibacterium pelagium TaxID=426702 RepID=A0A1H7N276_9LACT|nr:VanZ family protein [Alkalibacterium pelagium]GEN51284.1 membrane protein [Alkalibacterium pelagium]SEL17118.1 VanZ like family protein [Alkalibacterium pelagium]